MVCPFRLVVMLLTALVVVYIAVKEFIWKPDPSEEIRKKKQYKWYDYYTGRWAWETLRGKNFVDDTTTTTTDESSPIT